VKKALAEWLMPNNFEPVVGRKFRFHVDPMPGPYPGGSECEVLEVDAPRRLVYSWACLRKDQTKQPPLTKVTWTLTPEPGGTRLTLEHSGLEHESFWLRFSMNMGWGRMVRKLLPRVLRNGRADERRLQIATNSRAATIDLDTLAPIGP